jgi:hypothetical protein
MWSHIGFLCSWFVVGNSLYLNSVFKSKSSARLFSYQPIDAVKPAPRGKSRLAYGKKDQGVKTTSLLTELIVESLGENLYISEVDIEGKGSINLSDEMLFRTDLMEGEGREQYRDSRREFDCVVRPSLLGCQTNISRVAELDSRTARVYFSMSFIPDSILPLWLLGRILPVRTEFYDILDRESFVSHFSWRALRQFFSTLLFDGVCRLPHAVIKGSTNLEFVSSGSTNSPVPCFTLKSSTESLDLVKSFDPGQLKNRRIVGDLLQFLDARRPLNIGINAWGDRLDSRLPVAIIPGMGQFDIDGITPENRQGLLNGSNKILGYLTGALFVFSAMFGTVVMENVLEQHAQRDSGHKNAPASKNSKRRLAGSTSG